MMATLLKERARKPVIATGLVYSKTSILNGQMMYGIVVQEPWLDGTRPQAFELMLTEQELLGIFGEHLKTLSRRRPSPGAADE